MSAIKETPDRVGTTFFRVKYGLDDFLEFFFGPFIEPFFWTILSGGGSTPSALREGLDAIYRY